jgi:hypothetical protein
MEYLFAIYDRDPELGLALEQLAVQRINIYDRISILENSFDYIATVAELTYISDQLGIYETL